NESGKTALLKALHKFHPAISEPYVPQREFPRDRFTREFQTGIGWPVCAVEFGIEPELQATLKDVADGQQFPTTVIITKCYDGTMRYAFDPEPQEDVIDSKEILSALEAFSKSVMRIPSPPAGTAEADATIALRTG